MHANSLPPNSQMGEKKEGRCWMSEAEAPFSYLVTTHSSFHRSWVSQNNLILKDIQHLFNIADSNNSHFKKWFKAHTIILTRVLEGWRCRLHCCYYRRCDLEHKAYWQKWTPNLLPLLRATQEPGNYSLRETIT